MKKLLFIAAGLIAGTAFGASSGTLTISGTVAAYDDIKITATADATNLDILNGEAAGKKVADVVETSNRIGGYKIQMTSANSGVLKHTTLSSSSTGYTVSYNGSAFVSLASLQEFAGQPSLTALTSKNSVVDVKVTAKSDAVEGTYQDVITISIVAN